MGRGRDSERTNRTTRHKKKVETVVAHSLAGSTTYKVGQQASPVLPPVAQPLPLAFFCPPCLCAVPRLGVNTGHGGRLSAFSTTPSHMHCKTKQAKNMRNYKTSTTTGASRIARVCLDSQFSGRLHINLHPSWFDDLRRVKEKEKKKKER